MTAGHQPYDCSIPRSTGIAFLIPGRFNLYWIDSTGNSAKNFDTSGICKRALRKISCQMEIASHSCSPTPLRFGDYSGVQRRESALVMTFG